MSLPEPVPPKIQALYESAGSREEQKQIEAAFVGKNASGYHIPAETLASVLNYAVSASTIKLYRRAVIDNQETE